MTEARGYTKKKRGRFLIRDPSCSSRGFTLIELLVVLTIMALVLAVAPPLMTAAVPGFRLREAQRELAAELRRAHREAIAAERETEVVLRKDSYERKQRAAVHALPRGVGIDTVAVPPDQRSAESASVRFYPDGSSSGGEIILAAGARRAAVKVNWLTGQVVDAE